MNTPIDQRDERLDNRLQQYGEVLRSHTMPQLNAPTKVQRRKLRGAALVVGALASLAAFGAVAMSKIQETAVASSNSMATDRTVANSRSAAPSLPTTIPVMNDAVTPEAPAEAYKQHAAKQSTTTSTTKSPISKILGILSVPTIELQAHVLAGDGPEVLKRGLGLRPRTVTPGAFGNAVITGNRTTYGAPLFRLDELMAGDQIRWTTDSESWICFVVDSKVVLDPPKGNAFADPPSALRSNPKERRLTITTMHPLYSAKQRLVVSAVASACS
jgi:LPXTG-site transpeptidase (sortase) family protein